jgi:hypothetical protein
VISGQEQTLTAPLLHSTSRKFLFIRGLAVTFAKDAKDVAAHKMAKAPAKNRLPLLEEIRMKARIVIATATYIKDALTIGNQLMSFSTENCGIIE